MTKVYQGLFWAMFMIGVAVCLLPFYWMFALGTHTNTEIMGGFPILPGSAVAENFGILMKKGGFFRAFLNSVFITTSATAMNTFFSALCGFAFAKYEFKAKNVLFMVLLATMMIPAQMGLVAFVKMMSFLGLFNTVVPLILQLGSAFGVFWMRQYIESYVPSEMLEAARVEGAGEIRIFTQFVLPLITPALVTYSILTFVNTWNSYLMPLVLLQDSEKFTLPLVIASLQGRHDFAYGVRFLAISIGTLPLIVFFLAASRKVIDSIATGAVKG